MSKAKEILKVLEMAMKEDEKKIATKPAIAYPHGYPAVTVIMTEAIADITPPTICARLISNPRNLNLSARLHESITASILTMICIMRPIITRDDV